MLVTYLDRPADDMVLLKDIAKLLEVTNYDVFSRINEGRLDVFVAFGNQHKQGQAFCLWSSLTAWGKELENGNLG